MRHPSEKQFRANHRQNSRSRPLRFEALEPRQVLAAANLVISEFMANNGGTLTDGNGEYSDWLEIRNASAAAVNLGDYFLTDSDTNLQKWAFPAISLNAGAYLVVFASAPLDANGEVLDNYVDGAGYRHTNFKLEAEGEYLGLTYEDPVTHAVSVVHEYGAEFPQQWPDMSYGIASDCGGALFRPPHTRCRQQCGAWLECGRRHQIQRRPWFLRRALSVDDHHRHARGGDLLHD